MRDSWTAAEGIPELRDRATSLGAIGAASDTFVRTADRG